MRASICLRVRDLSKTSIFLGLVEGYLILFFYFHLYTVSIEISQQQAQNTLTSQQERVDLWGVGGVPSSLLPKLSVILRLKLQSVPFVNEKMQSKKLDKYGGAWPFIVLQTMFADS